QHIPILPDSKRPVCSLIFHCWIPPPIEMHDMGGGGKIESGAACLDRQHEKGNALVLLELAYEILALLDFGLAGEDDARPPEHGAEECCERCGRLLELSEDQRLLLARGHDLRDVAKARELAAVLLGPGAVAEPLRGMVANLLEAHEEGQHDASALYALDV